MMMLTAGQVVATGKRNALVAVARQKVAVGDLKGAMATLSEADRNRELSKPQKRFAQHVQQQIKDVGAWKPPIATYAYGLLVAAPDFAAGRKFDAVHLSGLLTGCDHFGSGATRYNRPFLDVSKLIIEALVQAGRIERDADGWCRIKPTGE